MESIPLVEQLPIETKYRIASLYTHLCTEVFKEKFNETFLWSFVMPNAGFIF